MDIYRFFHTIRIPALYPHSFYQKVMDNFQLSSDTDMLQCLLGTEEVKDKLFYAVGLLAQWISAFL